MTAGTLPRYISIAAELRKLMRAPSVLDLVPAVKGMQQELDDFKRSNDKMGALVQELCGALGVGSAGELLPKMQALVGKKGKK